MRKIKTGCLLMILAIYQPVSAQKTITGFTDKTATEQKQLEQRFDALLRAERIGQTIKELSAVPHHVGSPGGKIVADNILNKFKSYGWDAKIETYDVLFPTPKTRVLEMISPTVYKALLKEPGLKEDAIQKSIANTIAIGFISQCLLWLSFGIGQDTKTTASNLLIVPLQTYFLW